MMTLRILKKDVVILTAAFLFLVLSCFGVRNADAHHTGKDLFCSDCHSIHFSKDGQPLDTTGPYPYVLKKSINDLCFMCHDGTDPSIINVIRGSLSAGEFSLTDDPNIQHSLGAADSPPGFDGIWNTTLTCVSCHTPHDNPYYRNLLPDVGTGSDLTVTYEIVPEDQYSGQTTIQRLSPAPENIAASSDVLYRRTEYKADVGISPWCAGCHPRYYGKGGDPDMGGGLAGDPLLTYSPPWNPQWTSPWKRHPTTGMTLSKGVANGHIDKEFWWSDTLKSRPPYVSLLADRGTPYTSDNEPFCGTCHKAHGSRHHNALIFDDPYTSELEDGGSLTGTCQACHLKRHYVSSPHGSPRTGIIRDQEWAMGECVQCHRLHLGNSFNLFTVDDNTLCYACHASIPEGGASGYPAREDDRVPSTSVYPGYFEYFENRGRSPGLENRVRWTGKEVFEDTNTYRDLTTNEEFYFSPHRHDPDMPRNGLCLNCHSPHGTDNPFDMLKDTYLPQTYTLCFNCHSSRGPSGMNEKTRKIAFYFDKNINADSTAGHQIRKSPGSASSWPDYIKAGDTLSCSNCHNPHGSKGNEKMANLRLISDQRKGWDNLTDTLNDPVQTRRFCFGCHVPCDDTTPSDNPTVEGIQMSPIRPEMDVDAHKAISRESCYNCHGKDYSTSSSFNVHHPKLEKRERAIESSVQNFPQGLQITPGVDVVELTWKPYTLSPIRGYRIYRGTEPGGPYTLIATQPEGILFYRDTTILPEHNYYYVLTVEDLYGQEGPYSGEAAATPWIITPWDLRTLEEVKNLSVLVKEGKIIVDWEESMNEIVAGYTVYRRTEGEVSAWKRLNQDELIRIPPFEDMDIEPGNIYFYAVVALDDLGNEGRFPQEIRVFYQGIVITTISVNPNDRPLKGGDEVTITLVGSPGMEASFDVEGIIRKGLLEGVSSLNEGIYYGKFLIPSDLNRDGVAITCTLKNQNGKSVSMDAPIRLKIDNTPPSSPYNLKGLIDSEGKVILSWDMGNEEGDLDFFKIYRHDWGGSASSVTRAGRTFTDANALPGNTYTYHLVSVDLAGNESSPSRSLAILLPPDTIPPSINTLRWIGDTGEHGSQWGIGETMTVILTGETSCQAFFSIGEGIIDVPMTVRDEKKGEYRGGCLFREGDDGEGLALTAKLIDRGGNVSVYTLPTKISILPATGIPAPVIYSLEDSAQLQKAEEMLAAGDSIKIRVRGTPGCTGIFGVGVGMDAKGGLYLDWSGIKESEIPEISGYALYKGGDTPARIQKMIPVARVGLGQQRYVLDTTITQQDIIEGRIWIAMHDNSGHPRILATPRFGLALIETKEPGIYEGDYRVAAGDQITRGYITALLRDSHGRISDPFQSLTPLTIDTSTRMMIFANPSLLKADNQSESRIFIKLTDAKGRGIGNRGIEVGLFTTPEYTGLVGLGTITGFVAREIRGNPYSFITDENGNLEFTYRAGFSAKTAIFRVIDTITGDRGTGFVTSSIEAQTQIQLYDIRSRKKAGSGEYFLSLHAVPSWLTADGVSRSRVIAQVTDPSGVPARGHQILFTLISGDGHLMKSSAATDEQGRAEVTYYAGRKIGTAAITARDTTLEMNACQCVATPSDRDGHICVTYIILKSDAPALVKIKAEPATLPADCLGTANVSLLVEDINGNPSRGVGLELSVSGAEGSIIKQEYVTDFLGQGVALYRAGCTPGTATITVRVTSRIPNKNELEGIIWNEDFPWQ